MSLTAAKPAQIFHVDKGVFNFYLAPWMPALERNSPVAVIYGTAIGGATTYPILINGQLTLTISLQAYKIKRHMFIAVGGKT